MTLKRRELLNRDVGAQYTKFAWCRCRQRDLMGALENLGGDRRQATWGRAGNPFTALAAIGRDDDPAARGDAPVAQCRQGHAVVEKRLKVIEP